ncbi:hypothetical protein ABFX02_10G132800 [Erythranthe guttata]
MSSGSLPTVVLIVCQCMYAGVNLISRVALVHEMSSRVFVVYRQFIAFLLISPFACFTRRETQGYWYGWKSFWLIFLLSFISVTLNQNLYFEGLYLASSSSASALGNLVPAITFIMAYTMGLEKVHLRSLRSVAKIVGTLFSVTGAITMALVKGPKLLNTEPINSVFYNMGEQENTWLLGILLLFGSSCCWSVGLILQVQIATCYPDHLSLTAWMCLLASIQSGILTIIFEPNSKANWKLNSSLEILCCLYAGLVSAVAFFGQIWCIARKGPFFSAMFNPLCAVVVTVLACTFLHEEMYTGRLVGALAVIIGLYIVLWGKAKDNEEKKEETSQLKKQSEADQIILDNQIIDLEEPLLPEKII